MDNNERITNKQYNTILSIDERIKAFEDEKDLDIPIKLKSFYTGTNSSVHDSEIRDLFALVEGQMFEDDYKIYTNPLNVDNAEQRKVGARLKNHNILKGVVNLYLGEFDRQPKEHVVTSSNNSYNENLEDGIRATKFNHVKQALVNQMVQDGFLGEEYLQQQEPIEDSVNGFKDSYLQDRLRIGQEAIDYIRSKQTLDEHFVEIAYDWIITGRCASFKEVRDNDVSYSHVPIEEMMFPLDSSKYIEDKSWCIRRRHVSDSDLIDMFGDKMNIAMFEMITKDVDMTSTAVANYGNLISVGKGGVIKSSDTVVPPVSTYVDGTCIRGVIPLNSLQKQGRELFHYVWKDINKVGILTYLDEFGQESIMEVSGDYPFNKKNGDIDIEYYLENILLEAYSIDNQSFFDIRVLETDRSDADNPSLIKLPYNGLVARSKSGNLVSFIKDGVPYQRLINGVHFQLEKLINKNKDKVIVMPYGLVPRKKGMSTTDTMYHMDSTGVLWVDETAPNAGLAGQMIKVLDLSLSNFINDAIGLIKEIKNEYWEVIGMNPQRFSDINQKAGKATTEQAIIRSSVISNDLFKQLDNLIEKDYNGLLDFSKFAWIGGIKGTYLRSDKSVAFITMNEDDAIYHSESSYNVFVKHSSVEMEAVEAMRQLALPYLQNQGNIEGAGILYSTNSLSKMRELLGKVEKQNKELEQITGEREHDRAVELEQMRSDLQDRIEEMAKYKVDVDYDKTIDSAMIRANSTRAGVEKPANDVDKALAVHQIQKDNRDLDIKEQEAKTKAKQVSNNNKNK